MITLEPTPSGAGHVPRLRTRNPSSRSSSARSPSVQRSHSVPRAFSVNIFVGILIALGVWVGSSVAQGPNSAHRGMLGLARFTPASSRLFVAIRRLDTVDEALDRAHAWRFLPLLSGHSTSASQAKLSLRNALRDFVGDSPELPFQAIESAELALIAPDPSDLESAVWLARSPDKAAFDGLGRRRANQANLSGAARFFATRSGLLVSVRGDVVAMARRSTGRASLSDTMLLMSGRHLPSLIDDKQFQALVSYLPARPLAVAYLALDRPAKDDATTAGDRLDLDRMTVGMYEGDGLLSFAVRATTFRPLDRPAVSGEAIKRLALLPRTTLLAAALRVDSPRIGPRTSGAESPVLARIKTLLMGLRDPARFRTPFPEIDPNVVLAWDQDLRLGRSTPQAALLLQTPNPTALQQEVAHLVINVLKLFDALSPSVQSPTPIVKRRLHLGTSIYSVDLGGPETDSGHPFERIVRNIEPSWAIIGKWFAIALSADHLERIIDAHRGIVPTLKVLPDAYALTIPGRLRISGQPTLDGGEALRPTRDRGHRCQTFDIQGVNHRSQVET